MLTVRDIGLEPLEGLLRRFGLSLVVVADGESITGSFWGEPEAGVVGCRVFARPDTPVHSVFHEAGHIVCMAPDRRRTLNRDAGGDDLEEAAVCYLQVLLGACLEHVGRDRLMQDMDDWGYSFRLGSTSAWFSCDAEEARAWLIQQGVISEAGAPTFRLRGAADEPGSDRVKTS